MHAQACTFGCTARNMHTPLHIYIYYVYINIYEYVSTSVSISIYKCLPHQLSLCAFKRHLDVEEP